MFFDRPESGELALLVHIEFSSSIVTNDPREFEELVLSAGGDPVAFVKAKRKVPHAAWFIGTGKLEEIRELVVEHEVDLVIFNHVLSPSQERNLEKVFECRVLDRTGLILDIFAQRARTHEGNLQVELAQLEHMSTRLVRGWTHLERQKGGIGLRGPGETQLESDRRLLRERIKFIQKRLTKVRKQREQGRRSRLRAEVPTISIVGYTNAGKSTLFNRITNSSVYAEDQLFATLDPTMRKVVIPGKGPAIIADTVGFISHLPHRLVEAFRSTLEEAKHANLLIHVIDAVAEDRDHNIEQVNHVLAEIGAADIPTLAVYNKIDLIEDFEPRIDRDDQGVATAVWLSAVNGKGVDLLLSIITEFVGGEIFHNTVLINSQHNKLRAWLYEQDAVLSEHYDENGLSHLEVRLPRHDFEQVLIRESINQDDIMQPEA